MLKNQKKSLLWKYVIGNLSSLAPLLYLKKQSQRVRPTDSSCLCGPDLDMVFVAYFSNSPPFLYLLAFPIGSKGPKKSLGRTGESGSWFVSIFWPIVRWQPQYTSSLQHRPYKHTHARARTHTHTHTHIPHTKRERAILASHQLSYPKSILGKAILGLC